MRFKTMAYTSGILVIFAAVGFCWVVGNVWGQCTSSPLVISGSTSMRCGGVQDLSASGGTPPYEWDLSGSGTLETSGGDNSSATYTAPASNANCANNATVIVRDSCKNMACIQIAVNCYTGDDTAFTHSDVVFCDCDNASIYCYAPWIDQQVQYRISHYRCDGTLKNQCKTVSDETCAAGGGSLYCGLSCGELPTNCDTGQCGGYECFTVYDRRSPDMKTQGCCPLDPTTGLPYDSESLGCEGQAINGGRPLNFLCPVGIDTTNITDANPVNVATGNKYEEILDLAVSSPGIPLEFRRSYNSQIILRNLLGYGWTHTYDVLLQVVQTAPTKRIRIWDSDGRALYFNQVQEDPTEIIFGGESGVKDRLKQVISTGEYFLRRKQGNLTYKFGSDGKLLEIFDPNGNTLTLSYTGGLLTEVSDNFGKTLSLAYNGENRISSVTDPKGQSILYEYTNGDLTRVTHPDTNSISYGYSTKHQMTDKYDTQSNLIGHWGNDTWGRVTSYYSHLKEGVPQEQIEFTYQVGSTLVTRSTGTATYTTAVIGGIRVVQQIQGCSTCGGVNKSFQYNNRPDLTQVTLIDGTNQYTTQYTYDNPPNPWEQVGEILQMTEALGKPEQRTTYYTYSHRTDDPFLLTQSTETIKSVVDPLQNKVITTTYDTQGNITSRQESGFVFINGVPTPKTYTTQYQYNILGQLTQINGSRTDVSDITTLEYYDNIPGEGNNRGRLKAVVNVLGQRTEFSDYDANGNVGRVTDPNSVITQRTYDQRNRITTITNLSTSAQTQYFYDIRGNLSYIILPEGNRIDFTYDFSNKLTEIRDNLGNKIQYQYDIEGNRSKEETKDPQGTLKKYLDFTYDTYKRLKRIVNPDAGYTEYTYDTRGNATAVKDPKNSTTTYVYDALSRLKEINQPLSTTTLQGYDTQDNQASITDPEGNTTQYFYDDFGRKNQTISPDTGTTDYVYDEAGNLTQREDGNGTAVNYTYDALNRLTAIQFPSDPNQNVTFTYDSTSVSNGIGRLTGRVDPSGTYVFHYDAHGNLIREEKTINSIPYTTQYTYNDNNILTSITYPTGRTITYTPDQVGRISQVDTTINGNPKTLASNITYLPFGGITGFTYGNGLTLTQGYDNQYRISSIQTGSIISLAFGYDANGNITSKTDTNPPGGQPPETPETYEYQTGTNKLVHINDTPDVEFGYDLNGNITSENTWTYVYDLSNQLIRVLDGTNQIAEYVYNGAGQRIRKVTPTDTTVFHYDLQGHIIAETNQSGQMIAEYVYLGDQLLTMIKPGELVYYFHNDHLGTPQVLTNEGQNISWKAAYTAFGQAAISVEAVENPFRFPGQYYDQETGLHYNYFRYYDPTTGRYITPDPIGLEGGINLFSYVAGDPINWIDSLGLAPKDRVRWVLTQYRDNKDAWKGSLFRKQNKCNEFVAAAHVFGDPDVFDYPTVFRENEYYIPTVADLSDPTFARSQLDYLPIDQAQPGDIIVWYDGQTHHSAIYIGNNEVIYQHAEEGLKLRTVQDTTLALRFKGDPIVRRYRYR